MFKQNFDLEDTVKLSIDLVAMENKELTIKQTFEGKIIGCWYDHKSCCSSGRPNYCYKIEVKGESVIRPEYQISKG